MNSPRNGSSTHAAGAGGFQAALGVLCFAAISVSSSGVNGRPLGLTPSEFRLLALLASGLQKYPFSGRLLLFLVPLVLVAVARGAWAVYAALRPAQPFAATVLLGLLLLAPAVEPYQTLRRRKGRLTDCRLRGDQIGEEVRLVHRRFAVANRQHAL